MVAQWGMWWLSKGDVVAQWGIWWLSWRMWLLSGLVPLGDTN
jgi:hypothetical protein